MNITIIQGNLIKNAEISTYANDASKTKITFAVSVRRDTGEGYDLFNCVAFGSRAAFIKKGIEERGLYKKGCSVTVSGAMQSSEYTGKDGKKTKSWSLIVDKTSSGIPPAANDMQEQAQPYAQTGYQQTPVRQQGGNGYPQAQMRQQGAYPQGGNYGPMQQGGYPQGNYAPMQQDGYPQGVYAPVQQGGYQPAPARQQGGFQPARYIQN